MIKFDIASIKQETSIGVYLLVGLISVGHLIASGDLPKSSSERVAVVMFTAVAWPAYVSYVKFSGRNNLDEQKKEQQES